jgi:hypothetical protein
MRPEVLSSGWAKEMSDYICEENENQRKCLLGQVGQAQYVPCEL